MPAVRLVITVGGFLIMGGRMNYIDLITFNLYITAFINPIRKLANFAEMFANGFAGLDRFTELMRTEPSLQDAPHARTWAASAVKSTWNTWSSPMRTTTAQCCGTSICISAPARPSPSSARPAGEKPRSALIPRFYDVTSGSIRIDGQVSGGLRRRQLHRNIGIVQQDVFLFADTVLENIRYGTPDATREQVMEAARRAEIYEDILAMPDGFDTYVGERGHAAVGGRSSGFHCAHFPENPPVLFWTRRLRRWIPSRRPKSRPPSMSWPGAGPR